MGRSGSWNALFDALLADEGLSVRIRETLQERMPAYAAVPSDGLDADVRVEMVRVLDSARAGRSSISEGELRELASVGEQRAQQGVPVDDMLRAWRMGIDVVITRAREIGAGLGVDDQETLEFVQSTLAWSDVAMVTTAGAHRQAELELALADQEWRAAFVRGVLFGSVPPTDLRVQAEAHAIDPGREYVAIRARPVDTESSRQLERALGFDEAVQHRRGLSAPIDGAIAGFLTEAPAASVDGVVGVGPPRPFDRLSESYRVATRALQTAQACGRTGVVELESLGLRAAVARDEDLGDLLVERHVEPLLQTGSSAELIATLRTYLACDMHVEQTAEQLFVHQNTVRYRIGRFEELTGASLRRPETAFEVWWALERHSMAL